MPHFSIQLFGLFDIQLDSVSVNGFRSNKARGLLAYLATEANRPIARTTLATLLWGDYQEAQARKSLRNTIANLRQILTPLVETNNLLVDRQTIQLITHNEHCTVDVVQFDELIRTAQTVASASSTNDLLAQAIALYQDDLFAGLPPTESAEFEDWRLFQQEVRHRQAMDALNTLTGAASQQNDFVTAATYARRQIQLEPWQERAHAQLMRIFALQGDRAAALTQFDLLARVLDHELGVAPAEETMRLYEQIRDGELLTRDHQSPDPQPPEPQPLEPSLVELAPVGPSPVAAPHNGSIDADQKAAILARLDPLPSQNLFGVERAKARLAEGLTAADRPWLIAIDGIGGIGKTTLATLLVHKFLDGSRFENIAWVSAKQEEFRPAVGIADVTGAIAHNPALDAESLTDNLLEQLMDRPPLTATSAEKRTTLLGLLKESPVLVVVDNLETVSDYQALIPSLRQLANPSKFLITTRFSLQSYSDIFCYSLTELERADALEFLRYEAETRNLARLSTASAAQLESIYAVVGGNPLALKLVLGQVGFLSLTQVLETMQNAQGKKVDQLYHYIYWQAWELLDEASRQLFLAMPAVDDGTFMELSIVAALEPDDLQDALSVLTDLSLVQVSGDLEEPRYRLHRLTETFLMNEVLKWQSQR